ncbi:hypothetical protein BgiBS90_011666 [Biomphalaria glabrata]|nr:hypothetical protein BgiBS90_011666 [Biomphalaria glabrata]
MSINDCFNCFVLELPSERDMTVILCGNKRLISSCWAACFLLNGLQAQSPDTDVQENLDLNQNVQSDTGVHSSSNRNHDINACHQNCYNSFMNPGYCDLTSPALKHCKQFQTECQKTILNNQTEFDIFADTKVICKYYRYMISTCSFDNFSTEYNSTILQDSLEKKRGFKNESSDIKFINTFYNKVMKMSPVTDLYTGFTYVNEEIYKLYAENRSKPIFWNISLRSDQEAHLYMYDGLKKCLNTTYFHSMNVYFIPPSYDEPVYARLCEIHKSVKRVAVVLWLESTELTLFSTGGQILSHPSGWWKIQCDLLKTSYQEDVYPCQVKLCSRINHLLLEGQCKGLKHLVLAFPVTSFLDFDPVRLFNYTKCFLNEFSNLYVNKSSQLPVISYLTLRNEKHIIFTLKVYVSYLSNNELEYSPHIMNMTWSMFTLIKHFILNNQNRSSLVKKQSIGLDTKTVCFAFKETYDEWKIADFSSTDFVCSDVIVNETFSFDKKELKLKFNCMQHLDISEESLANDASLVSKSVLAIGLFYFLLTRLCGVYAVAER